MDQVKSNKLTSLIAKLTIAANKAVKKPDNRQETRKRFTNTDFYTPQRQQHFEQHFKTAQLIWP
ncbi:MAG: hypothetical protein HY842_19440 [Bacteroidetes bacterium]|nr:hypothetical protein [Bacteroidota bacterium]